MSSTSASPDLSRLKLQRVLGRAAFALVGPGSVLTMRVIRNNRIAGVAQAREVYRQALATGRPTVICANHLTMVDSAYLHWALAPLSEYLLHYQRFSWNVAAVEHLHRHRFLQAITFLGKVVPIDRRGDEAHRKAVMASVRWLLSQGEVVTLFPEGTRSRTGRVEPKNLTYGIGQILLELERPQVLCAYLHGRRQEGASGVPAWGDILDLKLERLEPTTSLTGLRAVRDLSRQVMAKLQAMEIDWLAQRGMPGVAIP